jgi:hypothetical protein
VWIGFLSRGSGERLSAGDVCRSRARTEDFDFSCRVNEGSGSRLYCTDSGCSMKFLATTG